MNETELQTTSSEQKGGFMSRFGRRSEREAAENFGNESVSGKEQTAVSEPSASSSLRREEGQSGRDLNVFTEGLVIEGNVVSETGIVIRGTVRGSVDCRSDVEISGEIIGDVRGRNIRVVGGGVQGDIAAGEMLTIDKSGIKGNLTATHARINTPIEGDVAVRGTLTLQREANIQGNITAAALSVEEGASMNGRITISREVPEPVPASRPTSSGGRGRSSVSSKAVAAEEDTSVELVTVCEGRLPLTEEKPAEAEA